MLYLKIKIVVLYLRKSVKCSHENSDMTFIATAVVVVAVLVMAVVVVVVCIANSADAVLCKIIICNINIVRTGLNNTKNI